jgi:hypothetical protein
LTSPLIGAIKRIKNKRSLERLPKVLSLMKKMKNMKKFPSPLTGEDQGEGQIRA